MFVGEGAIVIVVITGTNHTGSGVTVTLKLHENTQLVAVITPVQTEIQVTSHALLTVITGRLFEVQVNVGCRLITAQL
jgi:hypothetical protein